MVKYLVEHGADLYGETSSNDKWTALHFGFNFVYLIWCFIFVNKLFYCFNLATRFKRIDIAKYLIERMTNLDIVKSHETPLVVGKVSNNLINSFIFINSNCINIIKAASFGILELVKHLHENGASINNQNNTCIALHKGKSISINIRFN